MDGCIERTQTPHVVEVLNILHDLLKCRPSEVWSCIVNNKEIKEKSSWSELMSLFIYFSMKSNDVQKDISAYDYLLFDGENDFIEFNGKKINGILNILDVMRVDYNHIDVEGNNFLHYISDSIADIYGSAGYKVHPYKGLYDWKTSNFGLKNMHIHMDDVNRVIQNTKDINFRNQNGETFIFHFKSCYFEIFKELVERNPELDLNVITNSGVNLIISTIQTNKAPIDTIFYLIEKGVSCTDVKDSSGNDICAIFLKFDSYPRIVNLFKTIISKNDIFIDENGVFKEKNFIQKIKEDIPSSKWPNTDVLMGWLKAFCKEVVNDEFKYSEKSIEILKKEMDYLADLQAVKTNDVINDVLGVKRFLEKRELRLDVLSDVKLVDKINGRKMKI